MDSTRIDIDLCVAKLEAKLEERRTQDAPWIYAAWLALFIPLVILCFRR